MSLLALTGESRMPGLWGTQVHSPAVVDEAGGQETVTIITQHFQNRDSGLAQICYWALSRSFSSSVLPRACIGVPNHTERVWSHPVHLPLIDGCVEVKQRDLGSTQLSVVGSGYGAVTLRGGAKGNLSGDVSRASSLASPLTSLSRSLEIPHKWHALL